ncbi:hypothetical protein [Bacillus ndiopicus]|uniref:hypothetical protein n=1 Tax=Bacillus ndiopicus TaxID=1347368 RepID=UPI0005A89BE1|nr:hypothetical protein [Bacillus ndiopicus]
MGIVIAIAFIIIGLIVVVMLFAAAISSANLRDQKRRELKTKKKNLNALVHTTLKHSAGLPLPHDTICDFYYSNDKIVIEGGGSTFNLSSTKIIDITLKTENNMNLIIAYDNDYGIPRYISFDASGSFKAIKIVTLFKKQPRATRRSIEL